MTNDTTPSSDIEIDADTATDDTEIPMRILRIATCPSLSGRSELTYHVGCNRESNAIHFRLWANTAAGMFSNSWVSMADVSTALSGATKITSASLKPIFFGISNNQAGFMLALLKGEGIVTSTADRGYECLDPKPFLSRINALIASEIDLGEDDVPKDIPTEPMVAEAPAAKRGRPKKT
jgi:hypothetical protein